MRTALYNYLFVKSQPNGKFILRIEDTDQNRLVDGATEQLCEDLQWAGIVPDEGPFQGGPYGPYIQSQRLPIYRDEVKKLLENGTAYYCFCTERRLELLRKDALKARQIPKYDNRCRHLTPVQIAEKLANQDTFCIRFKLDPYIDDYNDMVYGKIVYDVSANEGDPVIIKSDGYPTYHFANVVDDHLMHITHVLRGVEWQISTTKHLLMYRAFNWIPPKYAHLPLLMNADGTKLSKRQGNINIGHYRDNGIEPKALINFITLAGGGFAKNKNQCQPKCLSLVELQRNFDITLINAHSSRLNPLLLDECNRLELLNQLNDTTESIKLIKRIQQLIIKTYSNKNIESLDLDPNHIKNTLHWALPRIAQINDLVDGPLSFLWNLPNSQLKYDDIITDDVREKLANKLEQLEIFDKTILHDKLKEFSSEHGLKLNNFMQTIRTILSGMKV